MHEMVARLRSNGLRITVEDVRKEAGNASSLGRPHLARALVRNGEVGSVQEAFDRYLADDRDGFVGLDRLQSAQAIELAHESEALVVVAHPLRLREKTALDELRALGADGVEVIHPTADAAATSDLTDYALRNGLLVTGGSDFHAPSPSHQPGIELAPEHVQRLWERSAVTALEV
jgi:hypothetical protein